MLKIQHNNHGEVPLASTFVLLVFQYRVENGSDGWVFNNAAYPTNMMET